MIMTPERLTIYESWDLQMPSIPPRSHLYSIEPVGVGTPQVENLTSYIARLAEAHSISVKKLMREEIFPRFGRPYLLDQLRTFWMDYARALNGTNTWASDMVQLLEQLTLRDDLRFLTLLPWSEVVSSRGLLRHQRAWCPVCLEEQRQTGQEIYEPLLWALAAVTVCPSHQQRLNDRCPHCQMPLSWLHIYRRPGYCSRCRCWLGAFPEEVLTDHLLISQDELKWQHWAVDVIGELLATAPTLPSWPQKSQVTESITISMEQVAAAGRPRKFCRQLQAHNFHLSESRLWHWRKGGGIPVFSRLLQLCYCLGTSALHFLTGKMSTSYPVQLNFLEFNNESPSQINPSPKLDIDQLRQILDAVLANDEEPPPSLGQVARSLGYYRHTTITRRLPEQSRQISERYWAYRQKKGIQKKQKIREDVRQATFKAHNLGYYPSRKRVAQFLGEPGYAQAPEGRDARREALRELGLEK